jgi:hypothetical protein
MILGPHWQWHRRNGALHVARHVWLVLGVVGSGMVLNMEHSCAEIKERIHEIVLGEKPPPNLSSPFQVCTQRQHRTLMHPVLYAHA